MDAAASDEQPGDDAHAGPGREGQSDSDASWYVMKYREPRDEHTGRRQNAFDAQIDHSDEDDERLADGDDNQKARVGEQRLKVTHRQERRRQESGETADDDEENYGTSDAAWPTRQRGAQGAHRAHTEGA